MTFFEWLGDREPSLELYEQYAEFTRPHVESVHPEGLVDSTAGGFLGDVAGQGAWMGEQFVEGWSDVGGTVWGAAGDAAGWLGDAASAVGGAIPSWSDIEGKLGTIVLVGAGVLALLVLGSVAKR